GVSTGCSFVVNTCSGHGTCVPHGGCDCNSGFGGDYCSENIAARTGGAVVAGVTIPIIALVLVGLLCLWKRRNPHKPYSALLPEGVRRRFGMSAGYTGLWTSTSGNTGLMGTSSPAAEPVRAATSSSSKYGSSYGST
ncbi:hypothetical protein EON67_03035, partial [archaeon]